MEIDSENKQKKKSIGIKFYVNTTTTKNRIEFHENK